MSRLLEKYYNELVESCITHSVDIDSLNIRIGNVVTQNKIQDKQNEVIVVDQQDDTDLIVLDESSTHYQFPGLPSIDRNFIQEVSGDGPNEKLFIVKFDLPITRRDLITLVGSNWVNDEVINFYMNLLAERSEQMKHDGYPTVYAMSTFFIPRLIHSDYVGVQRWTRKIDIFSYDIILVPVLNNKVHWSLAIIHFKEKSIKHYDSMGKPNPDVLQILQNYLVDESLDKHKTQFVMDDWEIKSLDDLPRQTNASDCGIFSCMYAEYITRNEPITFSQQDMHYFREKMIYEIAKGRLLT